MEQMCFFSFDPLAGCSAKEEKKKLREQDEIDLSYTIFLVMAMPKRCGLLSCECALLQC